MNNVPSTITNSQLAYVDYQLAKNQEIHVKPTSVQKTDGG